MARTRPERRNETRARILQAAAECFARDGYERATLAQVAESAGFTVPTLYAHFESKLGLLEALLDDIFGEDLFDVLLPRGLTLGQKLELLIAHQLRWAEQRRFRFEVLLRIHAPEATADAVREGFRAQLAGWLAAQVESEKRALRVDAETTALLILAVLESYFGRWLHAGAEPGALLVHAPEITDVLLHGFVRV